MREKDGTRDGPPTLREGGESESDGPKEGGGGNGPEPYPPDDDTPAPEDVPDDMWPDL